MTDMHRRAFLLGVAAGLALAGPALAARDHVADIVKALKAQGYRDINVARTLLGRTRITAKGKRGTREIIVNPATGEILRDLRTGSGADDILGGDSGRGSGDGDDDTSGDDDDDDGGDDDDDGDGGGDDGGGDDDDGGGDDDDGGGDDDDGGDDD
jgi:hypothetical protein